ncbi:unnamed protein product [Didymodactylos carnosus]|uniref:TRPM SLOG domain-containing protein n=1 Tax=Didymodactylos carnosus TaxID=1234261 RepID=A0A8S2HGH5_9BILA|nr:unnamed protein product [Didymodactylos carnosus]CAF3620116.1 unnamed protein product [Didymodactylos carnosus]
MGRNLKTVPLKWSVQTGGSMKWLPAVNRLFIKRRTCTTFIPKPEKGSDEKNQRENRCGCKRLKREHSWEMPEIELLRDPQDSKWDAKKHTKPAFNNAYGQMPETNVPYIRCDIETKPDTLAELMFKDWEMREPKLIMCIIGGAKYFKLNERLEKEFIKGIIQTALRADGWIVTNGFKVGAVQLVGDAIYENKLTNPKSEIIAVGVSKWGSVINRESLLNKNNTEKKTKKGVTNEKRKGAQELEKNHTHFLLLDDGMLYDYDTKDYRTRFVTAISRRFCTETQRNVVPVVTIVVEGGPDTLYTIYNDLKHGIPVVLIDGSGRVPNLLAKFLARTKNLVYEKVDGEKWKEIFDIDSADSKQILRQRFYAYEEEINDGLGQITGSKKSDKDMEDLLYRFLYCLQPALRSHIKSFSLDSDRPLAETIFEAIIEARQKTSPNSTADRIQLLQLALAWDCIEVAKEHIIKNNVDDFKLDAEEKLFIEALELDRPAFVNTFIKLGFDLQKMFYQYDQQDQNKQWKLKWSVLKKLYNEGDKRKVCLFYALLNLPSITIN